MLTSVKPHILGRKEESMGDLTERDKEVLDFIKNYMKEHGAIPSMREIGKGVFMGSTRTVHTHLQNLIDKGYIIKISEKRYKVRGMKYVEEE